LLNRVNLLVARVAANGQAQWSSYALCCAETEVLNQLSFDSFLSTECGGSHCLRCRASVVLSVGLLLPITRSGTHSTARTFRSSITLSVELTHPTAIEEILCINEYKLQMDG
jgi:hypothetical protein